MGFLGPKIKRFFPLATHIKKINYESLKHKLPLGVS